MKTTDKLCENGNVFRVVLCVLSEFSVLEEFGFFCSCPFTCSFVPELKTKSLLV